jgi:hypothetical protein
MIDAQVFDAGSIEPAVTPNEQRANTTSLMIMT